MSNTYPSGVPICRTIAVTSRVSRLSAVIVMAIWSANPTVDGGAGDSGAFCEGRDFFAVGVFVSDVFCEEFRVFFELLKLPPSAFGDDVQGEFP